MTDREGCHPDDKRGVPDQEQISESTGNQRSSNNSRSASGDNPGSQNRREHDLGDPVPGRSISGIEDQMDNRYR